MRVLHLVESPVPAPGRRAAPSACEGALLACARITRTMPGSHEVVLMGPSAADAAARGLGLRVDARFSTPRGSPRWGARAFRSWSREHAPFDLVCAWSACAATLARHARSRAVAAILLGPPSAADETITHADAAFVFTDSDRSAWGGSPTLVRIDADPAPADPESIRRRLGLDPRRAAVVHLADPAETGDPVRFMFIAGLVDRAGCPLTAILPNARRGHARIRRLHEHGSTRLGLVVTDLSLHVVLPACGLALIEGGAAADEGRAPPLSGGTRVAIDACRARGVRVIAPPFQSMDRAPVLSARGVAPQELAATMLAALEHPAPSPDPDEAPDRPCLVDGLLAAASGRVLARS